MFEKLDNCPSCGHPKFINHLICTDHTVSGESFALVKCDKCELIFTNPRPAINQLAAYYQSDNYISHSNKANSLVNSIYKLVRSITLGQKIKLINKLSSKGNLLDFGCGTGHFLNKAKSNDWRVSGIEPDPSANKQASSLLSQEVHSSLDQLKDSYDIITAWHVIEHVPDLLPTVKQLSKLLKDDGKLIIALPNNKSFDAQYYKEHWAGYDVPRHLYHFTQSSFEQLISKSKLKLTAVLPMKFDSYYVSLLSEKYLNKKSGFIKAFNVGRKSNQLAKTTSEYSSLIYILSK